MAENLKEVLTSEPAAKLTVEEKLRLLLDITKKISRSRDVDEVLNLVMDTLGSLMVGVPTPAGLRYVGQVGTGFTEEVLQALIKRLRAVERKTPPFVNEVPRVHSSPSPVS